MRHCVGLGALAIGAFGGCFNPDPSDAAGTTAADPTSTSAPSASDSASASASASGSASTSASASASDATSTLTASSTGGEDASTSIDPVTGNPGATTTTGDPPLTSTSTSGGANLDFELNLSGYGPHVGQDVFVKVFDEGGSELGEADQTLDSADETVTIAAIISASGTYTVRWWVDLNGSGSCEAPPDDHSWEVVDADADAGGLSIDHAHDVMFSDVCDSW